VPAQIVLVHDDSDFNIAATLALTVAGYGAASFVDPMSALDALEVARTVEALITRVRFGPGKPNGIALARMARLKRPDIRVLFVAQPEFAAQAAGLGDCLAAPVTPTEIVEGVRRLLATSDFRPC
jgi:DNA-binding NtrC family response regulator